MGRKARVMYIVLYIYIRMEHKITACSLSFLCVLCVYIFVTWSSRDISFRFILRGEYDDCHKEITYFLVVEINMHEVTKERKKIFVRIQSTERLKLPTRKIISTNFRTYNPTYLFLHVCNPSHIFVLPKSRRTSFRSF